MTDSTTEIPETDSLAAPTPSAVPMWLFPAVIVAAVVCGLLGEFVVGNFQRFYYPPDHDQLGDPPWYLVAVRQSMMINDSIGYGALGTLLFGILGALIGMAKSTARAGLGLILGAIAGLIAGAVSGPIGYYIENTTFQSDIDSMLKVLMILGTTFACFGLTGALLPVCLGVSKGVSRAIVIALLVACLTMAAYATIASAVFPIGYPNSMFPKDVGIRYVLWGCLGLCSGLSAALIMRKPKSRAASEV